MHLHRGTARVFVGFFPYHLTSQRFLGYYLGEGVRQESDGIRLRRRRDSVSPRPVRGADIWQQGERSCDR